MAEKDSEDFSFDQFLKEFEEKDDIEIEFPDISNFLSHHHHHGSMEKSNRLNKQSTATNSNDTKPASVSSSKRPSTTTQSTLSEANNDVGLLSTPPSSSSSIHKVVNATNDSPVFYDLTELDTKEESLDNYKNKGKKRRRLIQKHKKDVPVIDLSLTPSSPPRSNVLSTNPSSSIGPVRPINFSNISSVHEVSDVKYSREDRRKKEKKGDGRGNGDNYPSSNTPSLLGNESSITSSVTWNSAAQKRAREPDGPSNSIQILNHSRDTSPSMSDVTILDDGGVRRRTSVSPTVDQIEEPLSVEKFQLMDLTASSFPDNDVSEEKITLGNVKCRICLDTITHPSATDCGHVFCYTCLSHAVQSLGRCPLCRKVLTMRKIRKLYI